MTYIYQIKKIKKYLIWVFLFIILFIAYHNHEYFISKIRSNLSIEAKIKIKNFFFKNQVQNDKISQLQDSYDKLNLEFQILKNKFDSLEFYQNKSQIMFLDQIQRKSLNIGDQLVEYSSWGLNPPYFYSHKIIEKPSTYIEKYKNYLIFVTGNGKIYYSNLDTFENSKVPQIDQIQSNLNQSFNDILSFSFFYRSKDCVENIDHTALIISGGALEYNPLEKSILLSVGDYRRWELAQDKKNVLGKIISIDIENKDQIIFSTCHRNPLSIYYNSKNNFIFSTEHGPLLGDEINLITQGQCYGWPKSSYGFHYGNYGDPNPLAKYVELAPLFKSHKDYGFNEPLFSFSYMYKPEEQLEVKYEGGPGLKNILPNIFSKKDNDYLVFGMKSKKIYLFNHDIKNNEFIFEESILINDRVRDVVIDNQNIFYIDENYPAIVKLNLKN